MMMNLMKLHIRNIFHQKFYYVCLVLFILMGPVLNFIGVFHTSSYALTKVMPQFVSLLSGEISLLTTIFIALFSCLDFTEGTTKNIIARGYTREKLLISKYLSSLVGITSMYLVSLITIFILFGANGLGYESGMGYTLINSIFKMLAYMILFTTVSFVLEKNGSAIIACLFIPSVVQTILSLLDSKLHLSIAQYWISNVSSKFLASNTFSNLSYAVIFYILYSIIFIVIGLKVIKRKEIK